MRKPTWEEKKNAYRNEGLFSSMKDSIYLGFIEDNEDLYIFTSKGIFYLWHEQDCCESVYLEDLGGLKDIKVGATIGLAEEEFGDEEYPGEYNPESYTWTFYKIQTTDSDACIRWLGSSNGYYSESVSCIKMEWEPDFIELLSDEALVIVDSLMEKGQLKLVSNHEETNES